MNKQMLLSISISIIAVLLLFTPSNTSGEITTIGDKGPATLSTLNNPTDVFLDAQGNVYIADRGNNKVRKVNSATGIITTFAGTGVGGYGGDTGYAELAKLFFPSGIAIDNLSNSFYIADTGNQRIRRVISKPAVLIDLEIKTALANLQSGTTKIEACIKGDKSLNDLKQEINVIDRFPLKVEVVDNSGKIIRADSGPSADGSEMMMKNNCKQFTSSVAGSNMSITVDSDEIIPESNENNNRLICGPKGTCVLCPTGWDCEFPTCTSGNKCKDTNTKAYQDADCLWSSEQTCQYGCDGSKGECNPPPCTTGTKCKDANTKAYQNGDCSWSGEQTCQYGCADNNCKPAPCGTVVGWKCRDTNTKAYQNPDCSWINLQSCPYGCSNGNCNLCQSGTKCKDSNTKAYQNPDCSWTSPIPCQYGCDSTKNDCNRCQGGTKCKDVNTKAVQNYDCSWSNLQPCSYGCDPNTNDCRPAPCGTSVGYKCKDSNTKAYQNADCNWSNLQPCQYGCDAAKGDCNPCQGGVVKCKDANTKATQNSDCTWSNLQPCNYGCLNGNCNPCQAGTKCKDSNTKATQNSDCSWTDPKPCSYGCNSNTNDCNSCQGGVVKCKDANIKATQNSDCSWSNLQTCQYGCDSNTKDCKPAPCGTVVGYKCKDANTRAYQNPDCSWTDSKPCPYGCNSNTNDCNPCQGGAVKCKDANTKGTQNSDCTWTNTQTCQYGCDTNTKDCKPAPCQVTGYKCKDSNTKAYQNPDCSWTSPTTCQYGCDTNTKDCKPAPCGASIGYKCKDTNTRAYQNPDCSWTNTQTCQYGCDSTKNDCKPAPCGTVVGYKCKDTTTRAYQNPDCTWTDQKSCPYGCDGVKNDCNACQAGVVGCKDTNTKGIQNSDCTWSSTQNCQYGCDTNTKDCKPAPCGTLVGYKCKDTNTRAYQNPDCTWTNTQACPYGCDSTKNDCKPAPCQVTGYKCKDSNTRAYQNPDCSWTDSKPCSYGCNSNTNDCNPCQGGVVKCKDANTKATQNSDCNWSNLQPCQYGCDSTKNDCKPAPCQVTGYKCKDSSTKAYQNPDCSWTDIQPCQYGCDSAKNDCNKCQVGLVGCKDSNTKATQNGDCTWSNPQSCQYGCDTNTKDCKPAPCGTVVGYKCKDSNTRAYQNPDCGWTDQKSCPYGCNSNTNDCNSCQSGIKCMDANTKATQNSDCTWTNTQSCQYGCNNGNCNSPPSPKPVLVSINLPASMRVGEVATVTLAYRNDGGPSSNAYISPSFSNDWDIVSYSADGGLNRKMYNKGDNIVAGTSSKPAAYPLIDFYGLWNPGETKTATILIKPKVSGNLWVQSRASFCDDSLNCQRDPSSGSTDQQGWYVHYRTVEVKPACAVGWRCIDSNTKAYQNADCTLAGQENCPAGCENGVCKQPVASSGIITTIAGAGISTSDGISAISANVGSPLGIAVDSSGNVFVAASDYYKIRKLVPDITDGYKIFTAAGKEFPVSQQFTPVPIGYGDGGPATEAFLDRPIDVDVDASNNIYIHDYFGKRIRKVDASTGIINKVADTTTFGTATGGSSGTGVNIDFAVDSTGNIYITDKFSNTIKKIDANTKAITTSVNPGTIINAKLGGRTLDASGNIYYIENFMIKKISTNGAVTIIAGTGQMGYSGDGGSATSAKIDPYKIAADSAGNVYMTDYNNKKVRKITASQGVVTPPSSSCPTAPTCSAGEVMVSAGKNSAGCTISVCVSNQPPANPPAGTVCQSPPSCLAGESPTFIGRNSVGCGVYACILSPSPPPSGTTCPAAPTCQAGETKISVGKNAAGCPISACVNQNAPTTPPSGTTCPAAPTCQPGESTFLAGRNSVGCNVYSCILPPSPPAGTTCQSPPTCVSNEIKVLVGSNSAGCGVYACIVPPSSTSCPTTPTCPSGETLISVGKNAAGCSISACINQNAPTTPPPGTTCSPPPSCQSGESIFLAGRNSVGCNVYSCVLPPTPPPGTTCPSALSCTSTETKVMVGTSSNGCGVFTCIVLQTTVAPSPTPRQPPIPPKSLVMKVTEFAGTGVPCPDFKSPCGDGGHISSAQFNHPKSVAIDKFDNIYLADSFGIRIRKIDAKTGTVTTIAGTGVQCSDPKSPCGDGGPAAGAQLTSAGLIESDSSGNIYIIDGNRIRKLTPTETGYIITTIAGTGESCIRRSGDDPYPCGDNGPATAAKLGTPSGLAFDSSGNIYISETSTHRIRKLTPSGTGYTISTIAGSSGYSFSSGRWIGGYFGDGGQPIFAKFNNPEGIEIDSFGDMYISDFTSRRLRKISKASDKIFTIAGTGEICSRYPFSETCKESGLATSINVAPRELVIDGTNNIYLTDGYNVVWKLTPDASRMVYTISPMAYINYPAGIAADSKGNIYASSSIDGIVYKLTTT